MCIRFRLFECIEHADERVYGCIFAYLLEDPYEAFLEVPFSFVQSASPERICD
jgi:hypothetical protein